MVDSAGQDNEISPFKWVKCISGVKNNWLGGG